MRLSEIGGETGFLERIRASHAAAKGQGLAVPFGDDAAVFDVPPGQQLVVTTDMLLEGVHFRRDWSDFYSIGWKAAAANLSDLAAMGAEPTYAFVSLGVAEEDTVEGLERLYDGFSDCLNRYGARLAGGDTNMSRSGLVVAVTAAGTVEAGKAISRTGARAGDAILVTGTLGDAAGGLYLLERFGAAKVERQYRDLVNAHRRPPPRIPAARAAAATGQVRSMMDLSDGLATDLVKLCAASGVGCRVDAAKLPISDALQAALTDADLDPLAVALAGGDDYELLLTVPVAATAAVQEAIQQVGVASTVIGEIARMGTRITYADGHDGDLTEAGTGWDHFPG